MEGAEAPSIRAFQNPPDGVREGDQLPPVVAAAQRLDSARQSFQYKADVAASAAAHLQGPMLIMHVLDHLLSLVPTIEAQTDRPDETFPRASARDAT